MVLSLELGGKLRISGKVGIDHARHTSDTISAKLNIGDIKNDR